MKLHHQQQGGRLAAAKRRATALVLLFVCMPTVTACAASNQNTHDVLVSAGFADVPMFDDTLAIAERAGVDYVDLLARCIQRERSALKTMLHLSASAGFDAASAEGHSDVLGRLLRNLGDDHFGLVLADQPDEVREAVYEYLRFDFSFGDGPPASLLEHWYPITFGKQN